LVCQAAALLANLCEVDAHRGPLVHALHVVPTLVALARTGARDGRFDAARALAHLACCPENHEPMYDQVSVKPRAESRSKFNEAKPLFFSLFN
jgi:hypothetical protein